MKLRMVVFLALLLGTAPVAFAGTSADSNLANIPPDTPERFMDRYGLFVRKDERKALKEADKQVRELDKKLRKAKTDEQRAALEALKAPLLATLETLIAAFWTARDADPTTPENEGKKLIDERISDIETERFFSSTEAPGLMFSSHGGYHGDIAKVYLLHGAPDALTTVRGHLFVPLMLWTYADETRGSILYAFLFAETGFGPYRLHSPEIYQMDPCGAINTIAVSRVFNYTPNKGCPTELQRVYQELANSTPSGYGTGYIFTWALVNFSNDPSIRLGNAMEAPVPAVKAARSAGSSVAGETPTIVPEPGIETVLAACDHCGTMIPGTIEGSGAGAHLLVTRRHVDWTVVGDKLEAQMALQMVVEGPPQKPLLLSKVIRIRAPHDLLTEGLTRMAIPLFEAGDLDALPPGTYRVSVYLKGSLRNRYNAWVITFSKS